MPNYMYIFRGGQNKSTLSPEELQVHVGKWMSWMDCLKEEGQLIEGLPFTGVGKTVTREVVTDGPYTEGQELVGGCFIMNASTLEEASQIAYNCPIMVEGGSVEVREILSVPELVEN
ncbi:MAG: hypothetical protein JKY52_15630 [Flavobacteriales bacterium]|nr:hypothetical protein [Flavobacteriales bacterium]